MRVAKIVVEIEAFLVDDVKEHVEALHGIVRLIIVRVASFRRPIGIFSSTAFVAAYGLAAHPLGDRGGLCIAQHGSFNWAKPGLHSYFNAHFTPCAVNGR